jgi:BlaI family penicillinase repressor
MRDDSPMVGCAPVYLDEFVPDDDTRLDCVNACVVPAVMMHPRLTRYELELMDVLWRLGEGTVQDVCDALERPLAYTTVMTTLRLLHSKKKVLKRVKRGRAHVYQPIVSRDEVSRSVMSDLQSVLFREQLPTLVLGLLEDGTFTHDDIKSLKAAIRNVEEQEK